MFKNKINNLGFTMTEVITVVIIIGFLSTGAAILFSGYRTKARDVRRVNDAGLFYGTLENFRRQEGRYPINNGTVNEFVPGEPLIGPVSGDTYLEKIPQNPEPYIDGNCPDEDYNYVGTDGLIYYIEFCLGTSSKSIDAGLHHVLPSAPICAVNCFAKNCGSDDCGGVCGPGCSEEQTCVEGVCQ